MWLVECRVARIRAQHAAEERGEQYVEPELPAEPDEQPGLCWTCRGTGELAEAAVRAMEVEAAGGVDIVAMLVAGIQRQREMREAADAAERRTGPTEAPMQRAVHDA